jgi:hypothetical protein
MHFLSILLLVVGLAACGSTQSNQVEAGSKLSGSISQDPPGGTLIQRDWKKFNCDQFESATWYRLSRPVGAMIWHQYIGIRIHLKNGENNFETSGLSNVNDRQNLIQWYHGKGTSNRHAHMISAKRYDNCRQFLKSVRRINTAMKESSYQNVGIRVLALVATPIPVLGGRPCANEAAAVESLWLTSPTEEPIDYCDDCTISMPNARWSRTSVDWNDAAFSDAELRHRKD